MTKKKTNRHGGNAHTPGSANTPGGANTPGLGYTPRGSGVSAEFLAGRRSMARELVESGGLPASRLGLEILFLLPDEFIEFYQGLYHRALTVNDGSVMHGRSGGLEKSKGQKEGVVLGSDNKMQASGAGKRYSAPRTVVGSENAFEVKRMVDRELMELVGLARQELRLMAEGSQGPGALRCQGFRRTWVDRGDGVRPRCGKFLKRTWKFCPSCGTRVEDGAKPEFTEAGEKKSDQG